ncbi:hypothetical protein [Morganella morganii]|uniref:hypothetical protein n=1 Tax=Morganella morganii TaxID=582 RepID=UPI0030CE3194|nr:hypothetical protein [Morganella morganii]HDF2327055.1 hypothetical protein [Morganella morganii]
MTTSETVINLSFNRLYIINMLEPKDFNTASRLYEDIIYYQQSGVIEYREIKTRKDLDIFMTDQIIQTKNGLRPIYHFESHGNADLSEVGGADHITWTELSLHLNLINRETDYAPLVFMACCHGYHAISAITMHNLTPFYYLVGPVKTISADALLASTLVFYKKLFRALTIEEAVSTLPDDIGVYCAEDFFIQLRIRHLANEHIGSNLIKHTMRLAEQYGRENILNPHPKSYFEVLMFFLIQLNNQKLLEDHYLNHGHLFLGKVPSLSFSQIYDMAEQYYCSGKNIQEPGTPSDK